MYLAPYVIMTLFHIIFVVIQPAVHVVSFTGYSIKLPSTVSCEAHTIEFLGLGLGLMGAIINNYSGVGNVSISWDVA